MFYTTICHNTTMQEEIKHKIVSLVCTSSMSGISRSSKNSVISNPNFKLTYKVVRNIRGVTK